MAELQREYLRGARRKAQQTRDYFDEEEEDRLPRGSAGAALGNGKDRASTGGGAEEEVDPLDAFMMGIDAQVVREKTGSSATNKVRVSLVGRTVLWWL
jgi:hypothetical protein